MNLLKSPLARLAALSLAGITLTLPSLRAQSAPQTVSLVTGWNAVWLEVEPVDADGQRKVPENVFTDAAIQTVITPRPLAGLADFFASAPGSVTVFNQDDWQQWTRTDPSNANNLPLISGNRPYLIEATSPVTLTLTGKVRFFRPTWTPDRYNLIGFSLEGTPTFETFFGPSGSKHPVAKIFRLDAATGNWVLVTGADSMVSDEAYWVFSAGPSTYMGPVAVDFDGAATGNLNFGGPADAVTVGSGIDARELDLEELVFTNLSAAPFTPELDLITPDPGPGSLVLQVALPAPDSLGYIFGNPAGIAANSSAILTYGANRNWTSGAVGRTNVYRLKTGAGSASFWLPVTALNNAIQQASDLLPEGDTATVAGLWVGEVILDAVTSIVEDGAPSRPAAGSAPMRLLLHSNEAGAVSLLSQVTIMQTKTADPELVPAPVLVIDPAKIPFYEGIKERNGKKVGVRIQSVSYAMPRKLDAASQAALLADTATYPELTEAGLEDFLIARQGRPPALAETYHLSWPMSGAVGAGKTVGTTLSLDPFHRSNPFRHAFHNRHVRGPQITRTITLVFDSDQAVSGRLRGSYNETLHGLIQSDLTLSGRIELSRTSPVSTLEGQ